MILPLLLACAASPHAVPSSSQAELGRLKRLANWTFASKALKLAPAHLAALAKNGFFVSPGGDYEIQDVYGQNDYQNLTSIVTADNVVELYHIVFDSRLRALETNELLPALERLTRAMLGKARSRALAGPAIYREAATRDAAFFGLADRLLGYSDPVPEPAAALVRTELGAIADHQGYRQSAIFPYQLDYSQFIVRGHYTRSPELGRYFQTMMLYGLAGLAVTDPKGALQPEQAAQAVLMSDDLAGARNADWNAIYATTKLFAGEADALGPAAVRRAAAPIFGPNPSPSRLADPTRLRRLARSLAALPGPTILDKGKATRRKGGLLVAFMGQRAIPDSQAMNRLTSALRPWYSPLDVGAVLGSRRAARRLDADPARYNPKGWSAYRPQREALAAEWAARPASYWAADLYRGTLDVLRREVAPPDRRAPRFMRSDAWADKCLATALAGWANLRHDTILYGEQTTAEMGDGDEAKPVVLGYVEPNVALYTRLLALLRQTADGLIAAEKLVKAKSRPFEEAASEFRTFGSLLRFFIHASTVELAGGRLTAAEHKRIRTIEGDLDDVQIGIQMLGLTGKYNTLSPDDSDMADIADVHTSGDQALEVAVGHADDLVAIVPIAGKLYLGRGSALSFYEFRVPISQRMSDHEWKALLQAGKQRPRPSWTAGYFVPISCRTSGD